MKKFMMVMLIGLALSTAGFAQGRDGGRRDSNGFNGRARDGRGFSARSDRGDRRVEGYRDTYGIGLGFNYAPAPRVYVPAPYAPACYEYDPVYCPPVVGGVIVRRGFERDRRFEHRDDGGRGFRR